MTSRCEKLRPAVAEDVSSIYALTRPLQQSGELRAREPERLQDQIDDFFVIEKNGMIVACAALHAYAAQGVGELACIATHPDCRRDGLGRQLLSRIEQAAQEAGLHSLFAVSTRAARWFVGRGFTVEDAGALPPVRKMPAECRKAKVLFKQLA